MQIKTIGELWERNAKLYPDVEAVVYGDVRQSYRAVIERARRLAAALYSLGAQHQERISMLARNRAEWFDYYAACEIHGYIAATLNFRLAADEIGYVLNNSEAAYLIFEDEYAALVERLRPRLPHVREYICIGDTPSWARSYQTLMESADPRGPPFAADPSDAVRLIYTSGTTGRPKGVVRGQTADLMLARVCATTSEMPAGCRELIVMPMFHIGGQSMASGAHWAGGTVTLHRDLDPANIFSTIESERIQVLHVTPTIVQTLLDHPDHSRHDISSLQTVVYAAAPMSAPLLKRALARFGNVFANCYGSTESGATITLQKRFHQLEGSAAAVARLASLGQEHQDSSVRIVDDANAECAQGIPGEIAVRCGSMMSGYWNDSSATASAFRDGWLMTGDVGYMDHEGFVYLVDRKADMVISGGENIYPREVENALRLHPDVKDVAVIGVPDDYWGEAVKAIIVRHPESRVVPESLIEYCKSHIARYKAPKTIEFADHLPVLASGKIDKVTLRRLFAAPKSPN
jgi:acyl-CoA synthetase (AMP-forming)/AMP-acid ligase II